LGYRIGIEGHKDTEDLFGFRPDAFVSVATDEGSQAPMKHMNASLDLPLLRRACRFGSSGIGRTDINGAVTLAMLQAGNFHGSRGLIADLTIRHPQTIRRSYFGTAGRLPIAKHPTAEPISRTLMKCGNSVPVKSQWFAWTI